MHAWSFWQSKDPPLHVDVFLKFPLCSSTSRLKGIILFPAMCITLFWFGDSDDLLLLLAFNRDEIFDRQGPQGPCIVIRVHAWGT